MGPPSLTASAPHEWREPRPPCRSRRRMLLPRAEDQQVLALVRDRAVRRREVLLQPAGERVVHLRLALVVQRLEQRLDRAERRARTSSSRPRRPASRTSTRAPRSARSNASPSSSCTCSGRPQSSGAPAPSGGGGWNCDISPEHPADPAVGRPGREPDATARLRHAGELAGGGPVVRARTSAPKVELTDVEARRPRPRGSPRRRRGSRCRAPCSAARRFAVSISGAAKSIPTTSAPRRVRELARDRRSRTRRRASACPRPGWSASTTTRWMSAIVSATSSKGAFPHTKLCRSFNCSNAMTASSFPGAPKATRS